LDLEVFGRKFAIFEMLPLHPYALHFYPDEQVSEGIYIYPLSPLQKHLGEVLMLHESHPSDSVGQYVLEHYR